MEQQNKNNYFVPFLILVFLFFIVGFLTTANGQFQAPMKTVFLSGVSHNMKNTFVTLITFSWFLAYPLTGWIGSAWITSYGYKHTLIRALCLMVIGLFIFWLSSWCTVNYPTVLVHWKSSIVPFGFFIFLLGSFITGASVTILQVVINPYLTACTVPHTQAIQRLSIGGASNSVGTTAAPYFVIAVVFGGATINDMSIKQLMNPFLMLITLVIVVILALTKLSLPDIAETKAEKGERLEKSVWSFRHLRLGIVAIFCYVGIEVAIGNNINLYAIELGNYGSPALMATLYWGGMLIGRSIAGCLNKVPPRAQLTFTTSVAAFLVILAIVFDNPWLLVAVGLFHSIMWGAIFTLSVNGLGKYTSVASGVFMIGVVGGAIIPLLQGMLADMYSGWHWTWIIVLAGELFILYYARFGSRIIKDKVS
jgi:FHS family L-fucose permease-like MFS transporter